MQGVCESDGLLSERCIWKKSMAVHIDSSINIENYLGPSTIDNYEALIQTQTRTSDTIMIIYSTIII